jgi:hypothetical protein
MKYPLKFNYYNNELNKIDYHTEYRPTIKIRGTNSETKWMDLNVQSADVLVKKLIKEFNLTIL